MTSEHCERILDDVTICRYLAVESTFLYSVHPWHDGIIDGTSQPTTSDHLNIKYIWGSDLNRMGIPCKPYGDLTLITHTDLQKVYTLNKYNFPLFINFKETI